MAKIRIPALKGIIAAVIAVLACSYAHAADKEATTACRGRYLNSIGSMRTQIRLLEGSSEIDFTYQIRNTVMYEHVYYGKTGKLRKGLIKKVYLGTSFAYMKKDGEYYLATNQHVVQMPEITIDNTTVEGVPAGARKVREVIELIRKKKGRLSKKRIPLKLVVADEAMDTAILKTVAPLKIMPYRMGDSAALEVGNIVFARGYPLGMFPSTNAGRVTAVNIPDTEENWNHVDFVTDAQLNDGNSGSPLFAISCVTGELELVGVYHAEYRAGKGMGLVVGINEVRELLETLRASAKKTKTAAPLLSSQAILNIIRAMPAPVFIPFANRVVRIDVARDHVRFAILPEDFPLETAETIVLVAGAADQRLKYLLLPEQSGKAEIPLKQLDPAVRDQIEQLFDALWLQAGIVIQYRQLSLPPQEADAAQLKEKLGEQIRYARREQSTLINAIDLDLIAAPGANER